MVRLAAVLIVALAWMGSVGPSVCLAQAFVTHVVPPAVTRGATVRVVVHGSDVDRASQLWTSVGADVLRAKVVGDSTRELATFDVQVSANAPVGLFGLRLATDDGLSNPVIFAIDDFKCIAVSSLTTPSQGIPEVKLPLALAGTFRSAQIDRFAIDVQAGEEVSFECVSSRLGKDTDPLLRIRDAKGKLIVEYDNDPGLFFDFRFAHKFAHSGRYTVELSDGRYHGHDDWSYVLRMGRFPAARVAVPAAAAPGQNVMLRFPELPGVESPLSVTSDAPLGRFYHALRRDGDAAASWIASSVTRAPSVSEIVPNNTWEQASKVALPAVLCGVLDQPNQIDYFSFELKKGDKLDIKAETNLLDSAADLEIFTISADGKEMQRVDDVLLDEASMVLSANKDGVYGLGIHDVTRAGGVGFAYRVEVRPAEPQLSVLADFAALTVPQDEYQSLPLVFTRTNYTGAIQLKLIGAPAGVTLENDLVSEGLNAHVARVRATNAAPLGVHTLQLVASAEVDGKPITAVARTQPMIDRQLYNVDLIKYALRENQRRLPPSLSDRIALQVTPPSPFAVELPEPLVTLVRYLSIDFPVHTTRRAGFLGEISFRADGGQIGQESEIRRQIYSRFTPATPAKLSTHGTFYSRNLPNEAKDRVDLSATAESSGRKVTLVRSFDLELKAAYDLTFEPKSVPVLPGESTTFRLETSRLPPFTGAITIEPTLTPGVTLPDSITIPEGASGVDVAVQIPLGAEPRKVRVRLQSRAQVGKFVEEGRPKDVEIDIKKPEVKPTPAKS